MKQCQAHSADGARRVGPSQGVENPETDSAHTDLKSAEEQNVTSEVIDEDETPEAPETHTEESNHSSIDKAESTVEATVERRTWNIAHIPAPSYAMRGKISGRVVHSDTDLRGIPRVEASVPARPTSATLTPTTRSTEDVVADQNVVLDLDAVLDARRAQ